MNNDNKVETAIAGLNCWASYATEYKSPKNCNFSCVPKVNLELWHDLQLPRSTKSKDLIGLQEIQKNLVKSALPMIQLLDTVLKLQVEQTPVDSSQILPLIADGATLLGHASYLTSLKRPEFIKPDIAPAYQSVCSKSNPVTTNFLGMNCPNTLIWRSEQDFQKDYVSY